MGTAGDARSFLTSGSAYDTFMGRYSAPLAALFADIGELVPGQRALDVGCGPGALTSVLADRLGVGAVSACDPSPPFVAECGERNPGVDVRSGSAEALPFESAEFDCVLAQLVLHFVDDPAAAMREFVRVTRPRGLIGACVWDSAAGMAMLTAFWDAALAVGAAVPAKGRLLRFGHPGQIAGFLDAAGLS